MEKVEYRSATDPKQEWIPKIPGTFIGDTNDLDILAEVRTIAVQDLKPSERRVSPSTPLKAWSL